MKNSMHSSRFLKSPLLLAVVATIAVAGCSTQPTSRNSAFDYTGPAGAGAHIPSSTACESCHLASLPAGQIAASATATAPGTGFAAGLFGPGGSSCRAGL